jgi:hypothetical protein
MLASLKVKSGAELLLMPPEVELKREVAPWLKPGKVPGTLVPKSTQ